MKVRLAIAAVVFCMCSAANAIGAQVSAHASFAGRPLAEALRDLQARGLRIVFSSELVRPGMRVTSEPRSQDDRHILDEILRPHGLEIQPGPGTTLLIVRARAAEAPAPREANGGVTIRGLVVDARSAAPIPGVLIRLTSASTAETVTDKDGRFVLTGVTAGPHTLFASAVGYTLARPDIQVAAGGPLDVTVALADGTGTYTEQVTVTGDPFRGTGQTVPSAMVLNRADLLELRGVLTEDPLRAVQALPGVAGGNDFRSEFSVRGSDYGHIGLSVDGMPVDWPVHAVRDDASGGSVSLINADVVDRMALSSAAYPQESQARTGAWLDFTIREGSRARAQIRGALSMTSASLVFEGPIGSTPRGSWLVATRQSFVQWVLERMGSGDSTAFGFTDVQAKGVYDLSPTQRLDATFIAGRSRLDLRRADTDPNLVGRGAADAVLLTAGWRSTRGANVTFAQRASVSAYGFGNDRVDGLPLADGSGASTAYRGAVSWTARQSTLLQIGTYLQHQSADQRMTRFIEDPATSSALPREELVRGSRMLWSADARASYSAAGGTLLDGGLLLSHATGTAGSLTVSPWLGVTVPLGGGLSLRSAAGRYTQHPSLDQGASGTFGDAGVRPERATHADVTLERRWGPHVRAQVTVYGRRERDMLRLGDSEYRVEDRSLVVPSLTPRWANVLDGASGGVEVLVQRHRATGLSGWLSYGYSRTRYDDRRTGERFFADFDQRHTFSAYAQQRVSAVTSVSAKLRVGSNFPVPGYLAERDTGLFVTTARNDVRLPTYARLDLRANRAFNFTTRRLTLFVEVVNLLGRANYAPGYDSMRVLGNGRALYTTQRLFPFLPTAGILVEF